jgi:hypothetical protein
MGVGMRAIEQALVLFVHIHGQIFLGLVGLAEASPVVKS